MAFDYKKEYKEFYMPKNTPSIVTVPSMNYIAVRGHGDPNPEESEYKQAIGLLYGIAFTIKMSKKGDHQIEGYYEIFPPKLIQVHYSEHPQKSFEIRYFQEEAWFFYAVNDRCSAYQMSVAQAFVSGEYLLTIIKCAGITDHLNFRKSSLLYSQYERILDVNPPRYSVVRQVR